MQREECEELFTTHKRVIDSIISLICRRNGWYGDEADDFKSDVYLRLLENDYRRVGSFRGGSSFERFLSVVIGNLARDHRNKIWGKWRPSARAKSLGPLAEWLERLLYRDGAPLGEACETIQSATNGKVQPAQVEAVAAKLKPKGRPQRVTDDELRFVAGDGQADRKIEAQEATGALEYAERCLHDALARLSDEDALIVKMRFFNGITVAAMSRALRLEQKSLYERFNRVVSRLRDLLQELCPDVDGLPEFAG